MANPDLTFQPQLNQRSLALAAAKGERELFSPRAPGSGATARRPGSAAAMRSPGEGAEHGCTFSPAINPASKQLVEDSTTVPADFRERQRFYQQKRAQAAQRAGGAAGTADCTFQPDTGNAVEVLAQSGRAGQLLEGREERYARMSQEEVARAAQRRAAKEEEVYGELAFQPQLNQRSLVIGRVSKK